MSTTITKPLRIITNRLNTQGFKTTLQWLHARLYPKLTGVPVLRYSEITPQIYIGPQYGAAGKRLLEQLGIHSSVNLRAEFDDAQHGLQLSHYCYLPTPDETPITQAQMQQAADFIAERIAAGDKVYIHCMAGVGRAPMAATAYFISQGMTRDAALALIRQTRPFITLNAPQMQALADFEATHRI